MIGLNVTLSGLTNLGFANKQYVTAYLQIKPGPPDPFPQGQPASYRFYWPISEIPCQFSAGLVAGEALIDLQLGRVSVIGGNAHQLC